MTREDAQLLADLIAEDRKGSSTFRTVVDSGGGSQEIPQGTFPQGELSHVKLSADSRRFSTFRAHHTANKPKSVRITLGSLRYRVFERDRGVCALCGIDTLALDVAIRFVRAKCETYQWNPLDFKIFWLDQFNAFLKAIGRRASRWPDVMWEADRIQPGKYGGAYILANVRTLCLLCHYTETNRLIYGK